MDRPELIIRDNDLSSFLRFTEPDCVLTVSDPASGVRVTGKNLDCPENPFDALSCFVESFDTGVVAGWISYDFTRLNPLYTLESIPPRPEQGPLCVLAHYPHEREQYSTREWPEGGADLSSLRADQARSDYTQSVRNIRTLIKHGYVYQINYSQRFSGRVDGSLLDVLGRLETSKLPPHTAYGAMGDFEFLSLSPERFFRVEDDAIITEPIKGTRPRGASVEADRTLEQRLSASEKDRAEHMMIVDLERNDLNRVCEAGTVDVPSLARLETFSTVHHLVSTVRGRLRDSVGFGDLIRHLFPGGSVTGCPKRIAIRTIDHLENRARGLYTGTVGYWDVDETVADWNIAIRTLQRYRDRAWWDSGGGIVIDSTPEDEYEESIDKNERLKRINNRLEDVSISDPGERILS